MEGLKRTKAEFFDSQSSLLISPFPKESKIEETRNPGQNYFNFINNNDFEEDLPRSKIKKPSRSERQQKIEKSRENFSSFLKLVNGQIKPEDFLERKDILLGKMKTMLEIPNICNVASIHKEYLSGEKTRKNYKNKNWNDWEIKLLLFMVIMYSILEKSGLEDLNEETWFKISKLFTNKNGQTCKFKFNSLLRSHPTIMSWTQEEDEFLQQIITEIKEEERSRIKWAEIAIKLNKLVNNNNIIRVGKHCRERWHNHLNPGLKKGSWSPEEDLILLEGSLTIGKKWAKISRNLPGRNENSVKNRFITLTKNIKFKSRGKKSDFNKDSLFVQEIKKIIQSLKSHISNESLNKSLENLVLNSPESSPSPERKSPLKSQNNEGFRKPSWPKENIADINQNLTNTDLINNLVVSNYNNYLLYMQFLNNKVISPQPQLEKQYQEIQKEIKSISQKDLYLSHLHFSTTSSETDRRGSGTTSKGDPSSKRPSNSYTSLLTPSVISENEELHSKAFFKGNGNGDMEISTNADSHQNHYDINNNNINSLPGIKNPPLNPKNKNKNLMSLVVDEMAEVKENTMNANSPEAFNFNMTQSWNRPFPSPTPPIMSFSNVSPMALNTLNQDYFRFSPNIDNNGMEKRVLSPIPSATKMEEEEMPLKRKKMELFRI